MATQFLRNAILRIGTNGVLSKQIVGLRIVFKFDKSTESTPNVGNISVYNVNADTRRLLESANAICSLDVGYGNDTTQIFIGNIASATTKKQGTDSIVELELGDGEKGITTARVNQSFPPGVDIKNPLDTIAGLMKNASNGSITSIKNFAVNTVKSFAQGLIVSGSAKEQMDTLTNGAGLSWSVQDGQLQIVEAGAATTETAVLVTSQTGLIGSPGRLKSDKKNTGKETGNGVEFVCLLNPKIKPGRLVKLESLGIVGMFKAAKVTHEGDNQGGTWTTKVEAFEVKT